MKKPVARIGFLLMYACGLRISEAATLEVTAIDGVNGLIRVVGKGDKERCVPLPAPVLTELRQLWTKHRNRQWLCPNPSGDGPITRHALETAFQKVVGEAGIKTRVTPHTAHGTATQRVCWKAASTSGSCRSCSDTPRSARQRSTRI